MFFLRMGSPICAALKVDASPETTGGRDLAEPDTSPTHDHRTVLAKVISRTAEAMLMLRDTGRGRMRSERISIA
jgi:hypothetical protein